MNSNSAIKVEGLSKKYLLNKNEGDKSDTLYGSFINNLKNAKRLIQKNRTEEFWALRDVSFEITAGDRVGIIGRNGAGKSTLLKILSRITPLTAGRIEYTGRMASLLEVGTGFHGDLSGRENIYLNGSILGMTKKEIDARFDEIVDFSEVEKFLDTPVKRYSSGMYVRLAFAVAAHLNSEILIVDEVLAVGDASFQKKSLGKMEEASQQSGKTILFVSHNMGQISSLCNKGILLNKGRVEDQGNIQHVITKYFSSGDVNDETQTDYVFLQEKEKELWIKSITLLKNSNRQQTKSFAHDEEICISIKVEKNVLLKDVILGVFFSDLNDKKIFSAQIPVSDKFGFENEITFNLVVPACTFTANTYRFSAALHIPNIQMVDDRMNVARFDVYDNGSDFYRYAGLDVGMVFVKCKWEF